MRETPIVALIAFVVAGALALLLAPSGAVLDDATSRDPELAEIGPDSMSYAGVGSLTTGSGEAPGPDTLFELGSITKTFTGLALAQAVQDKTVSLDDRLDKHLPELKDFPAGAVTLGDLAAHRSGPLGTPQAELVGFPGLRTAAGRSGGDRRSCRSLPRRRTSVIDGGLPARCKRPHRA